MKDLFLLSVNSYNEDNVKQGEEVVPTSPETRRAIGLIETICARRIKKDPSDFALAVDAMSLIRNSLNLSDDTTSIKLVAKKGTTVVSIKWFYEHSRHFKHIPPECENIVNNTCSQNNDFSWTWLIVGTNDGVK